MKAAKQYKDQWEEANWLRLLYLAKLTNELLSGLFRKTLIAINVLAYIAWQTLRGLWVVGQLLFLTEASLNKIERDETWIFRQIK